MNKTTLEVLSWNEPLIEDFSAENAVNVAKAKYKSTGWMRGTFTSVYLIHYTIYNPQKLHEVRSTFTGYTIFSGIINGKAGSITFLETGEHSKNGLISSLSIKPEAATNDFMGLEGSGKYTFENGQIILITEF